MGVVHACGEPDGDGSADADALGLVVGSVVRSVVAVDVCSVGAALGGGVDPPEPDPPELADDVVSEEQMVGKSEQGSGKRCAPNPATSAPTRTEMSVTIRPYSVATAPRSRRRDGPPMRVLTWPRYALHMHLRGQ